MVLKSNEDLTATIQIVRISENETANVKCKVYDSGFETDSLSLLENDKPVKNDKNANSIIHRIKGSKTETNFTCSAKRVNGNYQTRQIKVIPRLAREIMDNEVPCTVNKCYNNGVCVYRKGFENAQYCICTGDFAGENCQWTAPLINRTPAGANPNYLYASLGVLFVVAFIFALLYGREKKKRSETKKKLVEQRSFHHTHDGNSLENYEVCDGREDTLYVEQKQTYTLIVNEYDNVPSDERFQSKPLIKNQKRQNSLSVTEEVAQNQFKTDYSNITKSPRSPLTMDL